MQNGSVESFNGRLRDELLNEHVFPTIFHARSAVDAWRFDYNHRRPHTSLGGLTPAEFIRQELTYLDSRFPWPDSRGGINRNLRKGVHHDKYYSR